MKRVSLVPKLMIICFLLIGSRGLASDQKLPVVNGKKIVAMVNEEPITLEALNRAIAASHTGRPSKMKAGRIDYSDIMERLINTRLIVIEARNMGIHELPNLKKKVATYSRDTLIELLLEDYVKDIKADEDEVEQIYKAQVKEWKIKSIKFKREDTAKKIEAEVKAGKTFDTAAQEAIADGIAEGGETEYLKAKDLKPRIAELISKMEAGTISPVVFTGKNTFIIFKLEGFRFPETEDPEIMQKARRQALNQKRIRAANDYYSKLKQKNAKVNEALLESLDYESKEPGFQKLLQDERVIAEIVGENPLTVGDLAKALKQKFYHGIDRAVQSKRVNKKKRELLESRLQKRILLKEALKQGIDKTEAYKKRFKEYETSVIFGAFINRVVAPDIKMEMQDLKEYYEANSQEYTTPEMMRIKSLVFAQRSDAVAALEKLTKGTDFNWLSSHAEGQVDPNAPGLLKFEGKMLIVSSMPEGVQKVLSAAKPGEYRIYEKPEGHFYVLYIYHVVTPKVRPFDAVKEEIAEKVYNNKLKKAEGVWAGKLKEYYPVEIYREDLKK